jgi:hypothetical protein
MAKSGNYKSVIVETFCPSVTTGRHGLVHVRPAKRQAFPQELFVECSKDLIDTERFPVGTKFRLSAKLTDREGGTPFLYSYYRWGYEVVPDEEFERLFPDPERSAT